LWTIQNTGRDPFGEPTREPMSGLDVIAELGKRNVYSYEMHAEDLVPEGTSAAERDRILREARKRMADYDIKCTNSGANCHNNPVFKDGALTSNDPKVRAYALQRYINAIDVGQEVGCDLCNLWWGRDGTEVEASKNPVEAIKRLREALNYLQAYIDKQGYKHRLAMEPKPNEPRGDMFMPTVGHGLALIATLDKPENCGIVPEMAHIRMAGLNCYHEIAQALELGKLYGLHFNGQKPLRYDQDLRFGAEDLKDCFFVVKLVEDNKWDGTRSFDAHTYRSSDREEVWDFVEGCMRTYLILKEKAARWNADAEIQTLVKAAHGDNASVGRFSADAARALAERTFDRRAIAARGLAYEQLDQLTTEIILGVR
jgi:xylose isomerase